MMPFLFIRTVTEKNTKFSVLIQKPRTHSFALVVMLFLNPLHFMKVSITSRELEVLRKSADGLSIKQIASDLDVSTQLIGKLQKEILIRTGAGNILNALQALAKHGFVLKDSI